MPLTTLTYVAFFLCACLGAIILHPYWGLMGYLTTYFINPYSHWWGDYVPSFMSRYSLILGLVTLFGTLVHWSKLQFLRFFDTQEVLLITLIFFAWLSVPLGVDLGNGIHESLIKITKIGLIVLIASHLVTDMKKYEFMVYLFIITGLYLGIETYFAPSYMFTQGRLGAGIGGSDLSNGNMLAAHFALVLTFIGVMFLKNGWKTKILCILTAAFVVNGIVLIRSRGSFLGLIIGVFAAVVFAKTISRKKIIALLIVGAIGAFSLMDKGFLERMELIQTDIKTMDLSAKSRLDVWVASFQMASDYPFGVGIGNTARLIGNYNSEIEGLDTHNTFLRCLTDIGYHGLFVLFLLILNAFRTLRQVSKMASSLKNNNIFNWHVYAIKIGLICYLVIVLFVSATYTEEFYWLLMFPLFLKRIAQNELRSLESV